MPNLDPQKICNDLAHMQHREDTKVYLSDLGIWEDMRYWHLFGETENTYSRGNDQNNDPESQIAEKEINCQDAILIRKCEEEGLDPRSPEAPQSCKGAIKRYWDVDIDQNGSERAWKKKKQFDDAEIIITADGSKESMNVVLADNGCGQSPSSIVDTILSTTKSNKSEVPFVIGKHGQGALSILSNLGKATSHETMSMELYITRLHPNSPRLKEEGDDFVFTITRRLIPDSKYNKSKTSRIVYLTDLDGKPFHFSAKSLSIIPVKDGYQEFVYGCFCKLFDVQFTDKIKTKAADWGGLNNVLNYCIPESYIPYKVIECRPELNKNNGYGTNYGIKSRLQDSILENKNIVEKVVRSNMSFEGSPIKVETYVLNDKTGLKKWNFLHNWSTGEGGPKVLFTINGQRHASLYKDAFARKNVGLQYLADYLLVIVDCSALSNFMQEEVFKTGRDRFKEGDLLKAFMENFYELLAKDKELHAIQEERWKRDMTDSSGSDLTDKFLNLLKNNRSMSESLKLGRALNGLGNLSEGKNDFVGTDAPTVFKMDTSGFVNDYKEVQLTRTFDIKFKTDAADDFFTREDLPGKITIYNLTEKNVAFSYKLSDGTLKINIIPGISKIDETESYFVSVEDQATGKTWNENFNIKMVEYSESGPAGKPSTKKAGGVAITNIQEVTKEEWDKYDMDEYDGYKIMFTGPDEYQIYINVDNVHFKGYMARKGKTQEKINLIKWKYEAAMFYNACGIIDIISKLDDEKVSIRDDIIRSNSRNESKIHEALQDIFNKEEMEI